MSDDTQLIRPVGERRARREAERRLMAETGQVPVVDDWVPVLPTQRPPVPGGRRARRLAELATPDGARTSASAALTSLSELAAAPPAGSASGRAAATVPAPRQAKQGPASVPMPAPPVPPASLEELARVALGVAALPGLAPGGDPLTWDEVFATGVGLEAAPEEPGAPRAANPTLVVRPRRAGWQAFDDDAPFEEPHAAVVRPKLHHRWHGLERRTRVAVAVAATLALLGGAAGGWFAFFAPEAPPPAAPVLPRQATVLVGLVTGGAAAGAKPVNRTLSAAALLATESSSGDAVSLLAPGSLMLDVPGAGKQTLADAVRIAADAPADALSDALEVRVDGSWLLSPSDILTVVQALGGVDVEVAAEVSATGYTFTPGVQHFDGAAAAAYAVAQVPDEPEQARLARFESLLSGIFAAMPASETEIQALLLEHDVPVGTLSAGALAVRLVALRAEAGDRGIASTVLPFTPRTVGDTTVSSLDDAAVKDVVTTWLPGARLPQSADGPVRVLVQNGVGIPGLAEAAHSRLLSGGLRFEPGGNAQSFDYTTTKIVVPSDSAKARAQARRVAEALGVPGASVVVDPLGSSLADVIVVIGKDFADSVTDDGVQNKP